MLKAPNCYLRGCAHFRGVRQDPAVGEESDKPVCNAFPLGIPDDIAFGTNLHLEPVTGDGGIRFEKEKPWRRRP